MVFELKLTQAALENKKDVLNVEAQKLDWCVLGAEGVGKKEAR